MTLTDRVFGLLESSAVTQGVITALCLAGTFVLLLTDRVPPDWLISIDLLIVGFFFGGKLGVIQGRLAERKERAVIDLANGMARVEDSGRRL